MRRARLEGKQIGRAPMNIDREQLVRDRLSGMSITRVAKKHRISRASVCRLMKEIGAGQEGAILQPVQTPDFTRPGLAA